MAKVEPSEVARRLKELRKRVGLSAPAMARELGMRTTSYLHYEDRYKKPFFPAEFLADVSAVLRKHGVPEEDIATLGPVVTAHVTQQTAVIRELRALKAEIKELKRKLDQ